MRTDRPDEIPAESRCEIRGTLELITYQHPETGYTIARLQQDTSGGSQRVTVVGTLAAVPVGSTLVIEGCWSTNPRYGRQFKFDTYRIARPNTLNGLERYLGSGLIKGIGPKYAERIVAHFGLETLTVLEENPDRLLEVEGLGRKRLELIKQTWQVQREIHQVMVFLQGHGISANYSVKIYKTYGRSALEIVQANPYRLAEDIWGIGFRVADSIALALGVPANDWRRARAGLLFALNESVGHGHCFLPRTLLLDEVRRLLKLEDNIESPDREMDDGLTGLLAEQITVLEDEQKIRVEERDIYLAPLYFAEQGVAASLIGRCNAAPATAAIDAAAAVEHASKRMHITLTTEQRRAIIAALQNQASVITGGPGTGKSTILRTLIMVLDDKGISYRLAAPTGRAAKRLGESCGRDSSTIHRLLEFDASVKGFKKNRDAPLKTEMVVVDEASMLDISLANALFRALPEKAGLVLVGDADQLPSVGPGNVLQDIIASGRLPVARLNTIFRQEEGSLITFNAQRINQGAPLELLPDYKGEKDFYCIFREDVAAIADEIVSLYTSRLPRRYGFDPARDIQVLSPMRKGEIGTEQLNRRLQSTTNPPVAKDTSRINLVAGDKVMQVHNNYDKEVFNGDLGLVDSIEPETQQVIVNFENRLVPYDFSDLDELALAYATTVHKSQGSEFPCVIIPVHTSHYPLLQRNLLYTAVTRARKLVILVGSSKAINIAIRNNSIQQRNTKLREKLTGQMPTPGPKMPHCGN